MVLLARLEIVGREANREGRNAGVQLHLREAGYRSLGHEMMSVDTAIDHQCGYDNGVEAVGLAEPLRQQRLLEWP